MKSPVPNLKPHPFTPHAFLAVLAFAFGPVVLHGQTNAPTVRFHTNLGDIDVVLTPAVAPLTVANFMSYVNAGAYTNTIFHRSVANFVIQGGGYQLVSGAPAAIPQSAAVTNEFNVTNAAGTIAMALTSDSSGNPQPNSGTNQWFFNLVNNGSQLDSGLFTVFGHIANAAGITVMNKIGALPISDLSSVLGSDFSTVPLSSNNYVVVSSIVPVPSVTSAGFQSAASFASSSLTGVSPGEFVVIYGQTLGPAQFTSLTVNNGVAANSLAGTQVLFNGKPAPMIYTSSGQVSAIVPYALPPNTVDVTVSYQGVMSNIVVFPVKPANPAIFTLNSSGTGDAAVVRLDGTIVNAANPAAPGDTLVLFGEGFGAATAGTALPDGTIVGSTLPVPADPTTLLLIDGHAVNTLYFGGAPSLVNGVLQVNFQVPALAAGSHQIQLQVGTRTSPAGVTLHTR